ncbi:MAG: CHAT domain-containing protein [Chloroflexi bacterium]|nr:CHAT domain-containing protein [Chloroflexota bacterium]
MPQQAQRRALIKLAAQLKAEAERQLNVNSEQSLAIADQIFNLGTEEGIRALGTLARADALRELGRYAEAALAYADAASLFRSAGDDVGWARTRIGATFNARYAGDHAQILADVDDARRILTENALWLRLTRLENHTGGLLSGLGRPEEALAAHRRALEAAERLEPRNELLEAEVLGTLALAYYQVDDFETAEALNTRATAVFEREGKLELAARMRRNFARFAAGRGDYSKALAAVLPGRRTLLELERIDAAAHLGQVGVDCLIRLGRPAEAAELATLVETEFESVGGRIEAAATHGLHAVALAQLGQAEAALVQLQQAEVLFGVANWDAGPSNVRLGRAVVLGETGRWREALAEAETVRDELRLRGSVVRAVQADLVRARALRALGEPHAAAAAAREALDLASNRLLPWLSYHAWRLLGELARDTGDEAGALRAFVEAIANLEQVQGRILTEYRATFLADKADVFEAAVDLLLRRDEVEQAFNMVERAKSRALVDALAGGLDIRIRPISPQQAKLAVELAGLRRKHDALVEQPEADGELRALEGRITRILEELRLAGAPDLERLSLLEGRVYSPQAQLGARTALLEFFRIGHDLALFVMDGQSLRAVRLSGALPRLYRLQTPLRLNLDAAIEEPHQRSKLEPNARALLQRTYDVLLRPVRGWLDAYDRLIVVPHGRLHQLPFGALHDGDGYLIERFEIATAPSASSLTFCLRPRHRVGQHVLVGGHSADGSLPGAIEEARAVANLYGDSAELLLEDQLTLDSLKGRAREADLIHLAAHGVSRLDAPLFSHLRLADGRQTALDCFDLELDAYLVTLSACESGTGAVSAGDEQLGLPRAFLYAGARAVIHSLWRIDDRFTRTLMERFYSELKAGRGRAAALRIAQLEQLHGGTVLHPFLWAPLSLVGDWREETT